MKDANNRSIKYMRLSITDACNFRCQYCMPDGKLTKPHNLSLENIKLIASSLNALGITKVKLTGGEPLIRNDISDIVRLLKEECNIEEVTLTTNGALLDKHLTKLIDAGLDALTISIDTLDNTKFNDLVRRNQANLVKSNIKLATNSTLTNIKLNVVPLKLFGDQNIIQLIEFAHELKIPIRFIEMMPIGLGRKFPGYDYATLRSIIEQHYSQIIPSNKIYGNGPASYYNVKDLDCEIGIISAVSNKFCESCNRIRVTSTGKLKQCLQYNYNIDLVAVLKEPDGLQQIENFIFEKPAAHAFTMKTTENIETLTMSEIGG